MIFQKLSKTVLLSALMIFFLASCEDAEFFPDNTDYDGLTEAIDAMTTAEYTADLAELDMRSEEDTLMQRFHGKQRCFKFVFPVTIIFPDGTELEVDGPEAFREAMHNWKVENPDVEERPYIQMPFDVELRDGTVQTIESEEQLEALKDECFENRPPCPMFKLCFEPVFPISISFPDGEVVEVEDMVSLHTLLRDWKEANPDAEVRPEIVFPIEIITKDGETVSVESLDVLKEYLRDCVEKGRKHGHKKGNGPK